METLNDLSNFNSNFMLISRNTTSCSITETYIWDSEICGTEPDTNKIANDLFAYLTNKYPKAGYKLTEAGNGTYLINSTVCYSSYLIQETDDGCLATTIQC